MEVLNKMFFSSIYSPRDLSSHLSIISKKPILVTTLHSQQGVFLLLFELDDLLLQWSVSTGTLWAFWGGTGAWEGTQLCTLFSFSSCCLCKLRKTRSLKKKNISTIISVLSFRWVTHPFIKLSVPNSTSSYQTWRSIEPNLKQKRY